MSRGYPKTPLCHPEGEARRIFFVEILRPCGAQNDGGLDGGQDGTKSFSAGQVILEFTFCMVIVMLMIYGVAKVFFWTGRDLAERRQAHDAVLTGGGTPRDQITPDFYTKLTKMNAIWNAN